jgi:ATP-dependent DNA helicase RecG
LASQDFINVKKMIEIFEEKFPKYLWKFKTWFLSWAIKWKKREKVLNDLWNWEINLLIWTHALIFSNESFKNLWLVLIDEQHKFWVNQREILTNFWQIHTLNISATPIPRTLALVWYWDLDISVLNEMPAGRQKIETKVIKNLWEREKIYRFLEMEMEKWRQIFVVCPLIEESERLDVKAVKDEFESLSLIFPKRKIWIIYWKIKAEEKKEIMQDFKDKKFDILVSTTVIEVWIDIKNANIMIIEWAERFWLSQLHQLRW